MCTFSYTFLHSYCKASVVGHFVIPCNNMPELCHLYDRTTYFPSRMFFSGRCLIVHAVGLTFSHWRWWCCVTSIVLTDEYTQLWCRHDWVFDGWWWWWKPHYFLSADGRRLSYLAFLLLNCCLPLILLLSGLLLLWHSPSTSLSVIYPLLSESAIPW